MGVGGVFSTRPLHLTGARLWAVWELLQVSSAAIESLCSVAKLVDVESVDEKILVCPFGI